MRIPTRSEFEALYIPEPNTGCWLWAGRMDKDGYGLRGTRDSTGHYHTFRAHRLMWQFEHGDVQLKRSELVCHRCDTPACVNPAHLFVGTAGDNNRDRTRKGRTARNRGVLNGWAQLTEAQVRDIKCDVTDAPQRELANRFGVSQTTISRVRSGKTWAHIE